MEKGKCIKKNHIYNQMMTFHTKIDIIEVILILLFHGVPLKFT